MNSEQPVSQSPLISVIIPAYNAEAFIERTLKSVLSQTYKNLEVLVVDDGSQDRTAEIVQSIGGQDKRVILLQQLNSGVAAARNLGIEKSQGEFIAPIDADDIWYPQNIEKQVQCFLDSDPSVGLVYSWSVDIDEDDAPMGEFRASSIEGDVYKTLICHNFLGNSSASIIRRACLEKIGGYSCQLKEQDAQGCEDWELYLRIAEYYQFRVVSEFLIGYRKIQSSMSRDYSKMAKSHNLILQVVRQNHPEIPGALYRLSKSSFYMYLARQSSQCGTPGITLFWLKAALQADWITPLWRYGLYTLSIKSFWELMGSSVLSPLGFNHFSVMRLNAGSSSNRRFSTITDFNQRQLSLRFKLLVGNLLHCSLLMI
ncbi:MULTISPECIES: glycosyltransferase family 2 protein [unclassified Coleofasciculus]|uniref:glycosyltransferase family 2 protein n=1 Tax=unclassified Coleofasciculus TaxID=2692782 RepID=UPI001882A3B0|nr:MULTISPECIES: glycosyltransferase family A protein [unclassified Coleofasciculus]MBE9127581.1 glycosyltransferase family 2 protein [Coleofasciculus sp. LEGE 07081]MBE9149788.1 glycosyltransferase family 2 protein [Coleofasciculus sp. LEGE 07092]